MRNLTNAIFLVNIFLPDLVLGRTISAALIANGAEPAVHPGVSPIQKTLSAPAHDSPPAEFHPVTPAFSPICNSSKRPHCRAGFSITHITKGFHVRFPSMPVWRGECTDIPAR